MSEMYYKKDGTYVKLTASDLGASDAGHTHDYLPLGGGVEFFDNDIKFYKSIRFVDSTIDPEVLKTEQYSLGISFCDKNNTTLTYIQSYLTPKNGTVLGINAKRVVNNIDYIHNIRVGSESDGKATFSVSDVASFRDALNLGKTSGALPIANGGTGATNSTDAANNLWVRYLNGGTPIPTNSDLNNYKTPGNYYVPDTTVSGTIKNKPGVNFTWAVFGLKISCVLDRSVVMQELIPGNFHVDGIYYRRWDGAKWDPWYKMAMTVVP